MREREKNWQILNLFESDPVLIYDFSIVTMVFGGMTHNYHVTF